MAKKEKALEQKEDELAITPVPETEIQPAEEKIEEPKKEKRPRPTFGQIMRGILLAILRLVIIVAVIGGCGAAVYFGVPFVYDNFVRPVEENTSQMNDINLKQTQLEFQIADLQTRLATLEAAQTAQSESLAEITSQLQNLETGQTNQDEAASLLDSRVQTLEDADAIRNETLAELTYQSDLLRAMELLSRARLFLYQSNFGLARLDVQAAHDALAEIQATAPESKQKDLNEALRRLDTALTNLPDFPVAASDDLDIAWQILLSGYPVAPTETPTPAPTITLEATPTLVPDLTATPIP